MYIALLTIATSNTKLLQFLDMPTLAPPARHYNNCIFCELLGHAPLDYKKKCVTIFFGPHIFA